MPCLSFYRPRGSRDYRWEKEEKPKAKEVLQRYRVFFFLCASPIDMAGGARDSPMLGARPLILSFPGVVSKLSHPILPRRAARGTKVLIHSHTGSRWCSDRTSVTVYDASFLLDRSGCRELLSGSVPEGKSRRPQHCEANVGAYNTVGALTCLEGHKAPFWHGLMVLSYRCVGYGPRICS